jgi:hypothetical protein
VIIVNQLFKEVKNLLFFILTGGGMAGGGRRSSTQVSAQ